MLTDHEKRLVSALEEDMSVMAIAALALEKRREQEVSRSLYERVLADGELIREVMQ